MLLVLVECSCSTVAHQGVSGLSAALVWLLNWCHLRYLVSLDLLVWICARDLNQRGSFGRWLLLFWWFLWGSLAFQLWIVLYLLCGRLLQYFLLDLFASVLIVLTFLRYHLILRYFWIQQLFLRLTFFRDDALKNLEDWVLHSGWTHSNMWPLAADLRRIHDLFLRSWVKNLMIALQFLFLNGQFLWWLCNRWLLNSVIDEERCFITLSVLFHLFNLRDCAQNLHGLFLAPSKQAYTWIGPFNWHFQRIVVVWKHSIVGKAPEELGVSHWRPAAGFFWLSVERCHRACVAVLLHPVPALIPWLRVQQFLANLMLKTYDLQLPCCLPPCHFRVPPPKCFSWLLNLAFGYHILEASLLIVWQLVLKWNDIKLLWLHVHVLAFQFRIIILVIIFVLVTPLRLKHFVGITLSLDDQIDILVVVCLASILLKRLSRAKRVVYRLVGLSLLLAVLLELHSDVLLWPQEDVWRLHALRFFFLLVFTWKVKIWVKDTTFKATLQATSWLLCHRTEANVLFDSKGLHLCASRS